MGAFMLPRGLKLAIPAFLVALGAVPLAHAIPWSEDGTVWRNPPEIPPANLPCTVLNYAAFADKANDAVDAYMFSGTCNINVNPEGRTHQIQKVAVQIESEWSPKLKRASEIVTVMHTDKKFKFTTWATCDKDPFIMGANATCKDQGMGGADFSLYVRRDSAPLAKSRVNAANIPKFTSRVSSRVQMRSVGIIKTMQVTTPVVAVGLQEAAVKTTFTGGPGACPMEIDFGDGYVQNAVTAEDVAFDLSGHPYTKPGTYTITARSLPGCSGSASGKIEVKAASVDAIGGRPGYEPARMGQTSTIVLSGRAGTCKAKIDFGDGKSETIDATFAMDGGKKGVEHVYKEPGHKNLKVTGTEGCTGSASGSIDVAFSAVRAVKNEGAVAPFQTIQVVADSGFCPLRVNWGDGVVEEVKNADFPTGTLKLWHQPKAKGKLLVQVNGIDGCVGTAATYLNVP